MMKEIQEKKEPVVAKRIEIAEPNEGGHFVSKTFEDCLKVQLIIQHKGRQGLPVAERQDRTVIQNPVRRVDQLPPLQHGKESERVP